MTRRYPLGPFLQLTGWSMSDVSRVSPANGVEYRLRRDRGVTELVADRLAVAAGLHPSLVWQDWFADELNDARARYNARKAAAERARYHRDPRRRQQALENARNYQQQHADYKNARKRARRQWLKENDPGLLRAMDRAAYQRSKARRLARQNRQTAAIEKITVSAPSPHVSQGCTPSPPQALSGEVAA